MNKFYKFLAFFSLLILSGCATTGANTEESSALEGYNHAMFKVNYAIEKGVIRPVAKGYNKVTNQYVRQRVTNFFNNIEEPVSMLNHVLQGEFHNSGQNFARFVINTTIGGLGLYDVASKAGLEKMPTGFDETMATWCVPDGPYIVLPILGPSTPRAATGWVADGYTAPAYWIANESGDNDAMWIYLGAGSLKYLNKYAENIKLIEGLEEGSVDYYETIKSAYLQNRQKLKVCRTRQQETTPNYDFDMDMDDEDD